MKRTNLHKYISQEVLLFVLCFAITIYTQSPAVSTTLRQQNITINQTTSIPDWASISFADFPKIESDGKVEVDGELRIWKKGFTPDVFLKLQDINVLFPNLLNLSNIMEQTKTSLLNTSLAQFPLVGAQTLEYLVNIVPGLGKIKVKNVAPIYELFKSILKEDIIKVDNLSIYEAKSLSPYLGALTLNAIDLSPYPIESIKNIEFVELGKFKNWEKAYINQIPGLNKLELAKYPVPLVPQGNAIGTVKYILGEQDNVARKTISGSYKVGFSYGCFNTNCSNIELTKIQGLNTLKSASWVWGKQFVNGGNGCLSNVSQGKEPTGRNPYGSLFKVVVDEIDDKNDKASLVLYFRFTNWCGATPYVVGPIPFQEYGIDSLVFLGSDNDENFIKQQERLSTKPESPPRTEPEDSINVKVLGQIIADFNNYSYDYISDYLVNANKKGRILGLYSFRSYESIVMEAIKSQPGGADWLKSIEEGKEISPVDVSKYLAPAIQDNLFMDYLTLLVQETGQEIDPTTGQSFSETRLLSRVVEKLYFGKASLVNLDSTDANDLEASSLIKNLVDNYNNKAS